MTRCPRCIRGRLWTDDGRTVCLLCSHVASDPVTLLDQLISHVPPVGHQEERNHLTGEREPIDLVAALETALGWGR